MANLQDTLNQAVADLSEFQSDAKVVADDQAKIATDTVTMNAANEKAQASVKQAIADLSNELGAMPPLPVPPTGN